MVIQDRLDVPAEDLPRIETLSTVDWALLLELGSGWVVGRVRSQNRGGVVRIELACREPARECPRCGGSSAVYDYRSRRWRDLDLLSARTVLEARVPRLECREHGVIGVAVPWAASNRRHTRRFERWILELASHCSMAACARLAKLSRTSVARIVRTMSMEEHSSRSVSAVDDHAGHSVSRRELAPADAAESRTKR